MGLGYSKNQLAALSAFAPKLQYLETDTSTSSASVYTFSSKNFGKEYTGRHIIVGVAGRKSGSGSETVSSITIGGVTATLTLQDYNDESGVNVGCLAIASVPTGTSGDIVVTFGSTMSHCDIFIYNINFVNSITAHDTASAKTGSTLSITSSDEFDLPINGVAVALALGNQTGSGSAVTWTTVSEDTDVNTASSIVASTANTQGTDNNGTADYELSSAFSGTTAGEILLVASWEGILPTEFTGYSALESLFRTYYPYFKRTDTTGQVYIDIDHTAENYYEPRHLEYFDYFNRMFLSVDVANGFVLGTLPLDSTETTGGSWALIDPDGALSINTSNGQLTVGDNTQLTSSGWYYCGVTSPAGNTFYLRLPVVDASNKATGSDGRRFGSYRFFDNSSSDDLQTTATLTPAATTGDAVTFTASTSVFSASDVNTKHIMKVDGDGTIQGAGLIEAYTSGTEVTVDIDYPFDSTDVIATSRWYLVDYDANGGDPDDGLEIFTPLSAPRSNPEYQFVKRGTDWTGHLRTFDKTFGTEKKLFSYGDPSDDKPTFTDTSSETDTNPMVDGASATPIGMQIWDIYLDGNDRAIRTVDAQGASNGFFVGVSYGGNKDASNDNGMYVRDCSNVTIKNCTARLGVNGDAMYIIKLNKGWLEWNSFQGVRGAAADSMQITGEGDINDYSYDILCRSNGYNFYKPYGASKGANANEEVIRFATIEPYAIGGFFAISGNGTNSCQRNGIGIGTGYGNPLVITQSVIGGGDDTEFAETDMTLNYGERARRAIVISGFSGNLFDGGHNRSGLSYIGNMILDCRNLDGSRATGIYVSEPSTYDIRWNIMGNASSNNLDLDKGTADISGTWTSVTRSGNTATGTSSLRTNMWTGQSIYVYGANQDDYNVKNIVVDRTDFKELQFEVLNNPATPATGTVTYHGVQNIGSRVINNNYINESFTGFPSPSTVSTFSGTIADMEQITITPNLGSGQVVDQVLCFIGGELSEEMTGTSLTPTIPVGSFGTDPHMCDLTDMKASVTKQQTLRVALVVRDTSTGYRAVWLCKYDETAATANDTARFIFYGSDVLKDVVGTPATWKSNIESFYTGKTVTIVDECTDARNASGLASNIDTMLSGYSVESYPTYVVIEPYTPDLTEVYANKTAREIEELRAYTKKMFYDVQRKGFIPALSDTPYRQFTTPSTSFNTIQWDDDDTAIPYDNDIIRPILLANDYHHYHTGTPFVQMGGAIGENREDNLDTANTDYQTPTSQGIQRVQDSITHGLIRYSLTGLHPKELNRWPFLSI